MVVAGPTIVDDLDPKTQDEEKKISPIEEVVETKIGDLEAG